MSNQIGKIDIKGWEVKKYSPTWYHWSDDDCDIMIHINEVKIDDDSIDKTWVELRSNGTLIVNIWVDNKEDIDKIKELIKLNIKE